MIYARAHVMQNGEIPPSYQLKHIRHAINKIDIVRTHTKSHLSRVGIYMLPRFGSQSGRIREAKWPNVSTFMFCIH